VVVAGTRGPAGDTGTLPFPARLTSWLVAIVVWYLIYRSLQPAADWLTYGLLGLSRSSHVGTALNFFVFEIPKVLMLLGPIVFFVGILRTFFTPDRTRQMLVGRREFIGNILAAVLGIPTPFCSCSAVPLFLGFVEAGIPIGVTFSFLISSPMVNEIALVLLLGMFGWRVAVLYVGTGLGIAIAAGWIIGRLRPERFLEEWVRDVRMGVSEDDSASQTVTWEERVTAGRTAVREIVGRVWPYLVVGIGVGSAIHGYVPVGLLASFMGEGVWWSVPGAVLLGVPLYSNAAGVVPVIRVLMDKGAALGTALAFMMAVIAISPPELVILRKVLRVQLLAIFVGVMAVGITVVGYLFNAIL